MIDHFASIRFGNQNKTARTKVPYGLVEVLKDEAFVSVAIFAGIGLLAALVGAICGVPGIWM